MESAYFARFRACALWKYGYTIALRSQLLQLGQLLLYSVSDGNVIGVSDEKAIEWIVIYPIIGQKHNVGRENQLTSEIEVRLMVADYHMRFIKDLVVCQVIREFCSGNTMVEHNETWYELYYSMQVMLFLGCHFPGLNIYPN